MTEGKRNVADHYEALKRSLDDFFCRDEAVIAFNVEKVDQHIQYFALPNGFSMLFMLIFTSVCKRERISYSPRFI